MIVADWICVVWQALSRATLVDWISGVGTTLTLASLWLYIWSERAASPRLAIEIGDRAGPTQYPHGKVLWVHVQVRNLPASRWERIPLFILRRPRGSGHREDLVPRGGNEASYHSEVVSPLGRAGGAL